MKKPTYARLDSQQSSPMRVRHWSWKLVLYPATICGLMFLVFLMQILTPNPLQGLIPSKAYTNQTLSTTHNPDIARPIIELHPENHVYRNPVAQHFNWEVTADYVRPDGVLKRVYLVNGTSPSAFPSVAVLTLNRSLSWSDGRSTLR